MPNPEPVEGRCNARLKHGRGFCGNKPHNPDSKTNKRCKFHGGMNTGPKTAAGKAQAQQNAIRHGLYAKVLKKSLPNKELQAVFDQVSRGTDLATEIALARTKVAQYASMKVAGVEEVETGRMADGTVRTVDVDTLLQRALMLVEKLTRSQHEMHPEAGAAGKLRISISVSGEAQAAAKADLPDLEAGAEAEEEADLNAPAPEPSPLDADDPLADLEP